jgi:succinate dehydrogenase/fumarate reductase cytochrome b subunit
MEAGTLGEQLNPWSTKLFRTLHRADPKRPGEQAAYSKWLDERSAREEARSDRIHGAVGVIPRPLWLVLFFASVAIFVYMLFFADSGERALTQAALMGSVVAVVVALLLLLQFLNDPFHKGIGGLRPVAMERTLKVIDQELTPAQRQMPLPCDVRGNAR